MKTLTLLLACLLLAIGHADAQIVDRTTDRAKNKANNRLDNRIDRGIDRGLDGIENAFRKKDKSPKNKSTQHERDSDNYDDGDTDESAAVMAMMQSMMGGGKPVDIRERYEFQHNVEMTTTMYDKKGKVDHQQAMTMYFSDTDALFGIATAVEGTQSVSVIDLDKLHMVMLMDMGGSKMAMTLDLDQAWGGDDDDDESYDPAGFTKTGRTKKILGYTCEEYVTEEEGDRMEFWITRDEVLDIYRAFGAMTSTQKDKGGKTAMPTDYPSGMAMEVTTTERNGSKTVMLVTAVNKNQGKTISTAGYSPMNLMGGGR